MKVPVRDSQEIGGRVGGTQFTMGHGFVRIDGGGSRLVVLLVLLLLLLLVLLLLTPSLVVEGVGGVLYDK